MLCGSDIMREHQHIVLSSESLDQQRVGEVTGITLGKGVGIGSSNKGRGTLSQEVYRFEWTVFWDEGQLHILFTGCFTGDGGKDVAKYLTCTSSRSVLFILFWDCPTTVQCGPNPLVMLQKEY